MKKRKLTNGKVVGKIFLWIFVSLFGMFLLACIFNIFMGTYKKLNHFQTFWNSTLLVIKKTKYAYSLMSLALVFGLGLFLFWKELKNWAKDLWARMTSQTSKDWIYNCATHEGSKKELNNLFRHQIADDTEANWLLTFSKNRKWWYVNDLDQNAIVNGPPGSGKTQRIIIPNIEFMAHLGYENKPNMIITDPKKEVIQFVGKTLENNDYKIYTIDFSNPEKSLTWNPLSAAYNCVHSEKTNDLNLDINHAYEIINNTVEALDWNISTGENSMWTNNAKNVIVIIAKFLLLLSIDEPNLVNKNQFNFETIANMLSINNFRWNPVKNDISKWILYAKKQAEKKSYYWDSLYSEITGLPLTTVDTLNGIFANATSVLSIFRKNEIIKPILRDSYIFNLKKIVSSEKPFAIFIHYPDHKPAFHFLVSMLIDQVYQTLIEKANKSENLKLKRKTFFLLDECGNLPQIPRFDNKLTISRSRNVFFMLILQDYHQLKKYSHGNDEVDKVLKSACQLVYFLASGDKNTLKEFSESLGTKEVVSKSYTSSDKGSSQTESTKTKPVMDVKELETKKPEHLIIKKPGVKPLMLKTNLAFECFINDKYSYLKPEQVKLDNKHYEAFNLIDVEKQLFVKINALQKEGET